MSVLVDDLSLNVINCLKHYNTNKYPKSAEELRIKSAKDYGATTWYLHEQTSPCYTSSFHLNISDSSPFFTLHNLVVLQIAWIILEPLPFIKSIITYSKFRRKGHEQTRSTSSVNFKVLAACDPELAEGSWNSFDSW